MKDIFNFSKNGNSNLKLFSWMDSTGEANAINQGVKIFLIALIAISVISCGQQTSPVEQKKSELKKLRSELIAIQTKIRTLENQLGKQAKQEDIVPVTVYKIVPETFNRFLDIQGQVESEKLALLSTTMGGTIVRINVSEGSNVRKGSVLIELDSEILEKSLAELQNTYEFVKKVYQKQSNLWDQKAISEIQFLEAKNNKESLELKIETVKRQIRESRIIAPFDGTIDRVFPKIGELVGPGSPIIQLSGGGQLKLVANVSENYVSTFKVGDAVKVRFNEINKEFDTKIRVISKSIDPRNRTFRVEIGMVGNSGEIRPNMLCNMKFNDISIPNSIIIPLSSLQKSSEGYFVYKVEVSSPARAVKQLVTVGQIANDVAQITSGLNQSELVISDGVLDVSNGQAVTIKN